MFVGCSHIGDYMGIEMALKSHLELRAAHPSLGHIANETRSSIPSTIYLSATTPHGLSRGHAHIVNHQRLYFIFVMHVVSASSSSMDTVGREMTPDLFAGHQGRPRLDTLIACMPGSLLPFPHKSIPGPNLGFYLKHLRLKATLTSVNICRANSSVIGPTGVS